MAGTLTTHVLDTERGAPAAGMALEWRRLAPEPSVPQRAVLDAAGRAVLAEGGLAPGLYEIVFEAGDYRRRLGAADLFFDRIPVHFRIGDPESHCHVPLVMSGYSYTTYRGG